MNKKVLLLLAICVLAFNVVRTAAQTPAAPPKVILIEREEIKTGRMEAHQKLANGYVQALSSAGSKTYWLGMSTVAGNENEALFITAYPSYAVFEHDRANTEKIMTGATKLAVENLDALGRHLCDHRRSRSAKGSATWRGAGACARHGLRDRRSRASRSLHPRQTGSR